MKEGSSGRRAVASGLLVSLLALALTGGTVLAHSSFIRSEPPAGSVLNTGPTRIQLWFTEPMEAGFSEVQVLDANRRRLDSGDSRVLPEEQTSMVVSLPPLDQGVYTVAWKALSSVDGHLTRGTYSLSVGVAQLAAQTAVPDEASAITPFEAVVRWLGYLSLVALLGALLTRLLVLGPAAERLGMAEPLLSATMPGFQRVALAGWVGLIIATLWALALQFVQVVGVEASGDAGPALRGALGQLVFGTRYGAIWLARMGLVLGIGLVLFLLSRRPPALAAKPAASGLWLTGVALGLLLLLTNSLNSHSASARGSTVVAIYSDWLHQVAVAVWVGGLFSLALVLPGGLRALQATERWRLLAGVIPRFSALAIASVGTLLATGIYQTWLHVGSVEALVETLYGKSLLVKLGLIVPLLLLGASNLLIIRPKLQSAVAAMAASPPRRLAASQKSAPPAHLGGRFRWIVAAEGALAALVLLASGVLTSLVPARQAHEDIQATRPLVMAAQAQDLRLTLNVAPARSGPSTFTVLVHGPDGRPVDNAERVDLRFSYLDEALGETVEVARPEGAGRYVAQGAFVSVEGRWQVEILVRLPGREDARTAFRFQVTATSAREEGGGAASPGPRLPELSAITVAAIGLVLLGIGLLAYVARVLGLRSLEGRVLTAASVVVIGLGVFLAMRVQSAAPVAPQDIRAMRNPFAPTQESLSIGQGVYGEHCVSCHGVSGRGDGPAAAVLNPRPADFRVHMAAGHTDGELFTWLSEGMQGTAMPAFKDHLSVEERWHVINYIRTFGGTP